MLYTFYKQYGNSILFTYVDDQGNTRHTKVNDYKPMLFTKSEESTEYKSIYGYNLKPIKFDSIKSAKSFFEQYKDVDGFEVEGNYKFANQFTIELYEGKPPNFNPAIIRGCILDIEVTAPEFPKPEEAKYPIDAICMYDTVSDVYTVFGLGDYDHSIDETDAAQLNIKYTKFTREDDLLRAIVNHIPENDFHYTSGWKSETFDMVYIVNRITSVLGKSWASRLSPYKIINSQTIRNEFGDTTEKVEIVGLPHLDYMSLYRKHIFIPRESYSLGSIASEELGETKLSYEEEGSLSNLSKNNFQKYISYNIKDVNLIKRLEDKLGLFNLTYTLAYYCISNFEDTLGTVRLWEQLLAKELYVRGKVPLAYVKTNHYHSYPGGYVSEPQVGRHNWVASYDLNSLYPMLEIQVNISPETYIPRAELPDELIELQDKLAVQDTSTYYEQVMNLVNKDVDLSVLKKYNVSMSACGQFYRRDIKGIIPQIKAVIYDNRKKYKKQMLQSQQQIDLIKSEMNRRSLS